MESPETIVAQLFRAVSERRYADVADFVDPDDVAALHQRAITSAKQVQDARPRSAVDYLRLEPDLPLAVAEYFAARDARIAGRGSFLPSEYAYVESIEDLTALKPAEVFARWIEARDPLYVFQRHAAVRNSPLPADYLERHRIPEVKRRVIGTVLESDDLAHVLYRMRWGEDDEGDLKLVSLRQLPGGWRVRFDNDFLGHSNWGFTFGIDETVDSDRNSEA